jgi:hypothetical protein
LPLLRVVVFQPRALRFIALAIDVVPVIGVRRAQTLAVFAFSLLLGVGDQWNGKPG